MIRKLQYSSLSLLSLVTLSEVEGSKILRLSPRRRRWRSGSSKNDIRVNSEVGRNKKAQKA